MSLNLVVVPSNAKGEPVKSDLVKLWYVMEGDHVHCSCTSAERAMLMIEEMKKSVKINEALATLKLINDTEPPAEYYDIQVSSEWAEIGRFGVKRELDKNLVAEVKKNARKIKHT